MSLASVHPVDIHSSHSSLTLSHSLDDVSSWSSSVEQVMTIEQLRHQLSSCFTCGVSWNDRHVSLDCSECGGYAMERPCPECDGHCGAVWKRDLTMSHSSGKARWIGACLSEDKEPDPNSRSRQPPADGAGGPEQDLSQRLEKLTAANS